MPTPEICPAGFDALPRRVSDLEVAAKRRLDDAVNADARLSENTERLDSLSKLLRRLIDGDEPVADARQDKAMRKRALIAALAEATGLGYKWKAAHRVANIIADTGCLVPPGQENNVEQLRKLFKTAGHRRVWDYLKEQRDLIRAAEITEKW